MRAGRRVTHGRTHSIEHAHVARRYVRSTRSKEQSIRRSEARRYLLTSLPQAMRLCGHHVPGQSGRLHRCQVAAHAAHPNAVFHRATPSPPRRPSPHDAAPSCSPSPIPTGRAFGKHPIRGRLRAQHCAAETVHTLLMSFAIASSARGDRKRGPYGGRDGGSES
jgi:hypothetical protein